jgi:hypothetical protein
VVPDSGEWSAGSISWQIYNKKKAEAASLAEVSISVGTIVFRFGLAGAGTFVA